MTFLFLSLEMQVEGIQEKEKGSGNIYPNRLRSINFHLTLNSASSNFCFLLCLVDSCSEGLEPQELLALDKRAIKSATPSQVDAL